MFRRAKKIDLNSLDKYTNGELLAYCKSNRIPITPNPTREQIIAAINSTPVTEFSNKIPPSSTPRDFRDDEPEIQTPKPFFFPEDYQPTPIFSNKNYEYDKMWERKLRRQNRKYKDTFPSNPGQISPSIKELSRLESQGRASAKRKINYSLYIEAIVFIFIIAFFIWFFMKF